ncbi:MAG: hypothetical protein K0S09_941, partial [Sphingobacteriaceae bacterium]|nr:hypothetical protein [Sphingobacteriaceae bacterium]
MNRLFLTICFFLAGFSAMAQIGRPNPGSGLRRGAPLTDDPSYLNPKEYTIGGISFTGVQYLD